MSVLDFTDSKSSEGLHGSVQFRKEGGEREEVRKSSPQQARASFKRPSQQLDQLNGPLATSNHENASVIVVDNAAIGRNDGSRIKSRDMFQRTQRSENSGVLSGSRKYDAQPNMLTLPSREGSTIDTKVHSMMRNYANKELSMKYSRGGATDQLN